MVEKIIKDLGFKTLQTFRDYMLKNAKLNEYGAVCYTEKRDGLEMNYSNNCTHKFGIGGIIKGQFIDHRFN